MKFSTDKSEAIQFQLAPMVDVVFLLLCFFMTQTIYSDWETEVDITLPTAATGEDLQRMAGEIIINVFEDGSLVVNGRQLSLEELGELLLRVSDLFPGQPVVIRGDAASDYGFIMNVMDRCREADIFNISFATGVPE
ncbi:biopolymer transporter ExbD [Kiritimatiellaeota bacterium B1221]|nr:biopolymer transporter ExbD [Kiritimatiellaeota bacterium B1221]